MNDRGVDDEALIHEQIRFYREAARYVGDVVGPADEAFNDRVLAYCQNVARKLGFRFWKQAVVDDYVRNLYTL